MSKYIVIYLMLLFPAMVFAQELHTTASGQKILYTPEGEWQIVPSNAKLSEDGVLTVESETSESVFEEPTVDRTSIFSQEQRQKINQTKELLKTNERKLYIEAKKLERKIHQFESLKPNDGVLASEKMQYKKQLNNAKYRYENVGRLLKELNQVHNLSPNNIQSKLDAIATAANTSLDITMYKTIPSQPIEDDSYNTEVAFKKENRKAPIVTGYSCEIGFEGKDPVTKKRKKETKDSDFFTYTHPKLKPHFKKDDFMTCQSRLTQTGSNYFITLNFRLKSKSAKKSYGGLNVSDKLQIEFIDGSKIFGKNTIIDRGTIEPYSGHTLYTGVYKIERSDLRTIEKKLIDRIGIVWSTGYEKYDIYNVDLLSHQVKCLKNR